MLLLLPWNNLIYPFIPSFKQYIVELLHVCMRVYVCVCLEATRAKEDVEHQVISQPICYGLQMLLRSAAFGGRWDEVMAGNRRCMTEGRDPVPQPPHPFFSLGFQCIRACCVNRVLLLQCLCMCVCSATDL